MTAGRAPTPAQFRRRFPSLEHTVHLASCSLGARSTALDDAFARMLDAMVAGAAAWHDYEAEVDRARRGYAALVGASPDQVALLPNASIGAYQVASGLALGDRDGIVTTTHEFPSIAHVWLAQRARGARVTFVDDDAVADRDVGIEDYERAVDERTALVSVPLATYGRGTVLPVAEIAALARARGAKVFVDAYQAAGVLPVDVDELGCDHLVAGSQKYLLGLPGAAFLYLRDPAARDLDPVLTGWFGRTDPFAFDPRRLDFPASARRVETGTPVVPSLYAATAGLGLVAELDLHDVRRHVAGLVRLAVERLTDQGERLLVASPGAEQGAHVGLLDPDPVALGAWLAERHIAVSPRGPVVRLSFHFYNDEHDVDALCEAVARFRSLSAGPRAHRQGGDPHGGGRVAVVARRA